eukprot:4649977-Prymnesium_polylepis.1
MIEIAEAQAATFRKDMAERDKATNDKIDKISTAQKSFFEQQKEQERVTEEREAAAAARQAQSGRRHWRNRCSNRLGNSRCP